MSKTGERRLPSDAYESIEITTGDENTGSQELVGFFMQELTNLSEGSIGEKKLLEEIINELQGNKSDRYKKALGYVTNSESKIKGSIIAKQGMESVYQDNIRIMNEREAEGNKDFGKRDFQQKNIEIDELYEKMKMLKGQGQDISDFERRIKEAKEMRGRTKYGEAVKGLISVQNNLEKDQQMLAKLQEVKKILESKI